MEITEPKQKEWVTMMKNEGVYIGNSGGGNCALYALVMYFISVFSIDQRPWLTDEYKLDRHEKGILDCMSSEVNTYPLFQKNNTNRSRFIVIFQQ